MLTIYTARYAYPGDDGLDITIGGVWKAKEAGEPEPEGAIFAPPAWLLNGYKAWQKHKASRSKITADEYPPLYMHCLRQHWRFGGKAPMLAILRRYEAAHGSIVLRCFCADGEFCHTSILKDVLLSICASEGIEAQDGGRVRYLAVDREWVKNGSLYAAPTLL